MITSLGPVEASVVVAALVFVVLGTVASSATLPRLDELLVVVEVLLVWPVELLGVLGCEPPVVLWVVCVGFLAVSADFELGLRQKISHKISQTIPAMIKSEMISHKMRPSRGLLFCSYILAFSLSKCIVYHKCNKTGNLLGRQYRFA